MKTETEKPELTDKQKIRTLAQEIAWVIEAYRTGDIKCKPMVDMSDDEAENWPIITLEERLTKTLNECGIKLK